jgi:hypothetical protein
VEALRHPHRGALKIVDQDKGSPLSITSEAEAARCDYPNPNPNPNPNPLTTV